MRPPRQMALTRAEDITALVTHARRWLRRVNVPVNNAGLYLETAGPNRARPGERVRRPLEVVRAIIETNLLEDIPPKVPSLTNPMNAPIHRPDPIRRL